MEAEKAVMRAVDARPIKKIAEAKARKRRRLQVRHHDSASNALWCELFGLRWAACGQAVLPTADHAVNWVLLSTLLQADKALVLHETRTQCDCTCCTRRAECGQRLRHMAPALHHQSQPMFLPLKVLFLLCR